MGPQVKLRIALVGDGAVGKTSLRRKYMGKGFNTAHLMTVGADHAVMKETIDGTPVTIEIWDLAGQKNFQSVRTRFYKGALGGICVFDLTRRETFNNISKWIEELWRHNGKGVIPIILLGNKNDLKNQEIKPKETEKFRQMLTEKTRKYGFEVTYLETSAKTGENVKSAFHTLGKQVLDKMFKKKQGKK